MPAAIENRQRRVPVELARVARAAGRALGVLGRPAGLVEIAIVDDDLLEIDDEVKQWISRDPVARYKTWLLSKKLASEGELAKIESDTQAAVEASIAFARQSKDPDPETGVLNTHFSGAVAATQFYNRSGLTRPTT